MREHALDVTGGIQCYGLTYKARGSIATSESSPSCIRVRKVVMVMVVPVMMPCRLHPAFVANRVAAAVVSGGRQIRLCLLRADWGGLGLRKNPSHSQMSRRGNVRYQISNNQT